MRGTIRRRMPAVVVAVIAALAVPLAGPASAAPGAGLAGELRYATGVVPSVVYWELDNAITAVEAAGFEVRLSGGWVDCGPRYVQTQDPAGGVTATLGSIVTLRVNLRPGPGQPCP
ncbi:hypothetical protein JOD54_004278 [Actinokineospora baliensis]|nr:hypothetical protein [Actinokineospora baliensis]